MHFESEVFVVYVDMRGHSHGALIKCKNRREAINCIEAAWEKNLLWHFKVYAESELFNNDSVVRYADLPWDVDSVSKVISLVKIQEDLENQKRSFESTKSTIVKKFSEKNNHVFVPNHGDVQTYISLAILGETFETLRGELSSQCIKVPEYIGEELFEALQYAKKITQKLSEMRHFHTYSQNNIYAVRPTSYTPLDFINHLPRIEDIFSSSSVKDEWTRLMR